MQQDAVCGYGDDRFRPKPASVQAVWAYCLHVLDEARGMACHPGCPGLVIRQRTPERDRTRLGVGLVLDVRGFLTRNGFIGLETREDLRGHVSYVGREVHRLMVAQKHSDLPALGSSVLLEAHQQVHDRTHIGAAVREVPGLYERRPAAHPLVAIIEQRALLQKLDELVGCAVDISYRDDAGWGRLRPHGRQNQQEGGRCHQASKSG